MCGPNYCQEPVDIPWANYETYEECISYLNWMISNDADTDSMIVATDGNEYFIKLVGVECLPNNLQ